MPDIRHRVGVAAPPATVYEQLATTSGVQRWWTEDVGGTSTVGETLTFRFGAPDRGFDMEVVELVPEKRVAWRCVDGPAEWVGTDITFDLRSGDETAILFTHAGWREPVEFMHHCSTKWASYLIGLKQGVETGTHRAFPHDERVSSWD
jgi:uncharacterized protein YndB with AHSA1/START domain